MKRIVIALAATMLITSFADAGPILRRLRARHEQQGCNTCNVPQPQAPQQNVQTAQSSEQFSAQYSSSYGGDDTSRTVDIVNAYRAQAGLHPLALDPNLSAYSQQWSQQMASSGFRHSSGWIAFGGLEVIAMGHSSPEDVVRGWMASPGHRNALMSPNVSRFGVGRFSNLWTGLTGR
jgi:uncharacterized protein YkwD